MYFIEKLIQLIKEEKSVVCMGLDPRLDAEAQIPKYLIEEYNNTNKVIIENNSEPS